MKLITARQKPHFFPQVYLLVQQGLPAHLQHGQGSPLRPLSVQATPVQAEMSTPQKVLAQLMSLFFLTERNMKLPCPLFHIYNNVA